MIWFLRIFVAKSGQMKRIILFPLFLGLFFTLNGFAQDNQKVQFPTELTSGYEVHELSKPLMGADVLLVKRVGFRNTGVTGILGGGWANGLDYIAYEVKLVRAEKGSFVHFDTLEGRSPRDVILGRYNQWGELDDVVVRPKGDAAFVIRKTGLVNFPNSQLESINTNRLYQMHAFSSSQEYYFLENAHSKFNAVWIRNANGSDASAIRTVKGGFIDLGNLGQFSYYRTHEAMNNKPGALFRYDAKDVILNKMTNLDLASDSIGENTFVRVNPCSELLHP